LSATPQAAAKFEMKIATCAAAALLLLGSVHAQVSPAPAPKQYPVTKVVTLLKDMANELEAEADADQELDEKMKCWCDSNVKEKTKSIADAQSLTVELKNTIDQTAMDSVRLGSEIEGHKKDLTKSTESLKTATIQREKQAEQFRAQEKDLLSSIDSLRAAKISLKKNGPADKKISFLSTSSSLEKAVDLVQRLQNEYKDMLLGTITPHQRKVVSMLTSELTLADAPGA